MEEKHLIKKAVFDISFGSESTAKAEQLELGDFMKSGLLPVVDEVFRDIEATRGGRIERLEIDLGVVDYLDFQTTLPSRLRIKLKTALEQALSGATRSEGGGVQSQALMVPSEAAQSESTLSFEALKVFLLRGRFPETEQALTLSSLDTLFQSHLQQNPRAFIAFLKHADAQERVLSRILSQCSMTNWQSLVEVLSPKQSAFLMGLAENFEKRLIERRATGSSDALIRSAIWSRLLDLLLHSSQGQIDVKQWLAEVLEKTAGAEGGLARGGSHNLLMSLLSKVVRRFQKEKISESSVLDPIDQDKNSALLNDLLDPKQEAERRGPVEARGPGVFPHDTQNLPSAPPEAHATAAELAYFRAWLYDAFTARRNLDEVRSMWPELITERADLLQTILMKAGRRVAVRRFMVAALTDVMLADIVLLIAPDLRPFVVALVNHPTVLTRLDAREEKSPGEVKKRVWECTLTYLIVDRGSRFNKKSYLESIVRQMSAHRNISAAQLLGSLVDGLAEVVGSQEMQHEMRQLLLEISEDWQAKGVDLDVSVSQKDEAQRQAKHRDNILFLRCYEYDALLQSVFLAGQKIAMPEAKALLMAIDTLAVSRPMLLLKLYRSMQEKLQAGGQVHWPKHADVLRRLTRAFLTLNAQAAAAPSELSHAFERYAERCTAQIEYCEAVLEALLNEQVIDFEDIVSTLADSKPSARASSSELNDPQFESSSKKLLLKLQVKECFVEGEFEDIRILWPDLLQNHPRLLRDVLLELGRENTHRLRLARSFPDAVLCDIVQLSEPKAAPFIRDLIQQEVFLNASGDKETGGTRDREVFWVFTLSYVLVQRGSRFNQKAYLGSLIGALAGHENRSYHSLLFFLKDHLSLQKGGPSVKSELVQILLELCEEARLAAPPSPESTSLESYAASGAAVAIEGLDQQQEKLQQSYDLFEYLKRSLSSENRASNTLSADESRYMVASLESLLRNHPWQLLRLFRELSAGGISKARFALVFSDDAPVRLIKVFLSLASSSGANDLIEAIQGNAEKVKDKALFYRQIFECLIQDRVIDFEVLLEKNIRSVDKKDRSVSDIDPQISPLSRLQVPFDKELPLELQQSLEPELGSPYQQERKGVALGKPIEEETQEEVPETASSPESTLQSYLQSSRPYSQSALNRCTETLMLLMSHQPGRLLNLLKKSLEEGRSIERLLTLLPSEKRAALLLILKPTEARRILALAELISTACFFEGLQLSRQAIDGLKWRYIFCFFFEEGRFFKPTDFIANFTAYLAEESYGGRHSAFVRQLCQQLVRDILPSTEAQTQALILDLEPLIDAPRPSALPNPLQAMPIESLTSPDALEPGEQLYVSNAGLVLVAPYFQRFFATLKMTDDKAFVDEEQAARAVHLLQYLVNESSQTPEYLLSLNKMLCGLDLADAIPFGIDLKAAEKELCEGLIKGMIDNWKVMKNTSVAGFRESFLQRDGVIELKDEAWQLTVFPKPYDMLLDQLPWAYATIRMPWMHRVLYVKWR